MKAAGKYKRCKDCKQLISMFFKCSGETCLNHPKSNEKLSATSAKGWFKSRTIKTLDAQEGNAEEYF